MPGCTCWVCLLWQMLQDVCRQMHLDFVASPLNEMLTGSLVYLQGSNNVAKVQAMQRAIKMLLNGDQLPALFITIVRYVLPSEDHNVQKLLLLYLVRLGKVSLRASEHHAASCQCPQGCHSMQQRLQLLHLVLPCESWR